MNRWTAKFGGCQVTGSDLPVSLILCQELIFESPQQCFQSSELGGARGCDYSISHCAYYLQDQRFLVEIWRITATLCQIMHFIRLEWEVILGPNAFTEVVGLIPPPKVYFSLALCPFFSHKFFLWKFCVIDVLGVCGTSPTKTWKNYQKLKFWNSCEKKKRQGGNN